MARAQAPDLKEEEAAALDIAVRGVAWRGAHAADLVVFQNRGSAD